MDQFWLKLARISVLTASLSGGSGLKNGFMGNGYISKITWFGRTKFLGMGSLNFRNMRVRVNFIDGLFVHPPKANEQEDTRHSAVAWD